MMRTFLLSIIALGTISLGTVGQAGATAVVDRQTMIGRQATVFFSASKTVTCGGVQKTASLGGFIFGAESISRSTGLPVTRSNGISFELFGYTNECKNASLGDGTGGVSGGLVGPGPLLTLATMKATSTVQDFVTGATLPVAMNLTFVGTGATSSSGSTTETHTVNGPHGPCTITIVRTANSNRSANVTGTFTINGDVFDLGGSQGGFNSNTNTTLTVTKP